MLSVTMQTFLPYPDFAECARVLDDKRLGKQRVECVDILRAMQPPDVCPMCQGNKTIDISWTKSPQQKNVQCPRCRATGIIERAWRNHPATRMWRGYEGALIVYLECCVAEWTRRGGEDTRWAEVLKLYPDKVRARFTAPVPPWHRDERLHSSHRAALLYKNPDHYKQFNWTETPKQDYYWPV